MVDSKWDDSNGLEFYKNTIRLTLHELEKQQRKNLLRLRRAGFSQNSSTPDCGHHGDNSFQEDHFSGIPTTLCINIAIFCIIILGRVLILAVPRNPPYLWWNLNRAWNQDANHKWTRIKVFSILRKRAWNYGRLGFENDEMLEASETVSSDEDAYLLELERGDSGNIFSWIRVIFQLSDREYRFWWLLILAWDRNVVKMIRDSHHVEFISFAFKIRKNKQKFFLKLLIHFIHIIFVDAVIQVNL